VSIHCGSRGLGHQLGTEFLRDMVAAAPEQGIVLPDRELACVRIESELGRRYLGAMRAAVNCAFANRQIITHLVREVIVRFFAEARLELSLRRLTQYLQARGPFGRRPHTITLRPS
jgi:tRNA-splicing ligase RtcB